MGRTTLTNNSERETSLSLLRDAAENDQEAWTRMTEVYGPLVYFWCRKFGLGPDDSADVFQEVFRSLAKNLANFKKENDGDKFRAYLWTVTRNKIRDLAKTQDGKAKGAGGTDAYQIIHQVADDPPSSQSSVMEVSGVVKRALEAIRVDFKERTWKMFWRSTVDDIAPAAVAKEFDVGIDSVYQAKSRVLRRLRAELGDVPI